MPDWVVGQEGGIHRSGRAIAQSNQDAANGNSCEAQADSYSLQWAKSAPPASADEIHCYDPKDGEQTESDDHNSKLAFGDHSAGIIAQ